MPARLYFGTWAPSGGRGIWGADWDDATGTISRGRRLIDTPNPTFVVRHPWLPVLYAVNEAAEFSGQAGGGVSAFAVNESDGDLHLLDSRPSGGRSPTHVAISLEGTMLAVANYHGPGICAFALNHAGLFEGEAAICVHEGGEAHSVRQDRPHPHGVYFDHDGAFLWVPDLGNDRIERYSLTSNRSSSERLIRHTAYPAIAGSGPRHLAFDPEDLTIYLVNELSNTLSVLAAGALGPVCLRQQLPLLPPGNSVASAAAEVAVHSSGRFVYASIRGADLIAVFARSLDGSLLPAGHYAAQGRTPRHFAIVPSGRWLIAANQDSDSLVVFAVDADTGALTPHGSHPVPAPACVCHWWG